MSQANPLIGPNKSGLTYRQEDNDGKQALLTHHKGALAPSYAEAGAIWLDDAATPWLLKMHDGVDWITLSEVNATENVALPYAGGQASRGLPLYVDSGSTNAYAASLVPAVASYTSGLTVLLKAGAANTGACTLALNGLSPVSIKMPGGANPPLDALRTGGIYLLCFSAGVFTLLNPSPALAGGILQTAIATYSSNATIATSIPLDDTIPTSTEGAEVLSVSITPSTTTSRMLIRVTGMAATTTASAITSTLFANSDTAAFYASSFYTSATAQPIAVSVSCDHTPGSLAPVTYKLRLGTSAGQLRPNGSTSTRYYGGSARWVMTVEEYA